MPTCRPRSDERPELIYDLDWDEDARLFEWQAVVADTRGLPSILRAALLLDAWQDIEVLQRGVWIGPLLVAALLRHGRFAFNPVPPLKEQFEAITA
ncbi:MAG: DUF1612 domain-containing protein [Rhizobiaceae bacterium]